MPGEGKLNCFLYLEKGQGKQGLSHVCGTVLIPTNCKVIYGKVYNERQSVELPCGINALQWPSPVVTLIHSKAETSPFKHMNKHKQGLL